MLFLAAFDGFGQQDAIYSQYMFNPFAINPAYAGTRNSYSAVMLGRFQWVGIEGAPNTQTFAVHAPTNKFNLAWGIHLGQDGLGPQNSFLYGATIGYHLKMKKSTLSFAIRGGAVTTRFHYSKLDFKDVNDPLSVSTSGLGTVGKTVPSIDAGMYYYTKKMYVGASLTHLTRHQIAFDQDYDSTGLTGVGLYLRPHMFVTGGYVFDIKPNFMIKPSLMVKMTPGAPINVDANVSFLLYKKFWLGASLRSTSAVVLMVDVNITDFLRMGYAFDFTYNALMTHQNGSHEVFLGFDFNLKDKNTVSPRLL